MQWTHYSSCAVCDQCENTRLQQPPPWLLLEVKAFVKIAMLKTGANHLEDDRKRTFSGCCPALFTWHEAQPLNAQAAHCSLIYLCRSSFELARSTPGLVGQHMEEQSFLRKYRPRPASFHVNRLEVEWPAKFAAVPARPWGLLAGMNVGSWGQNLRSRLEDPTVPAWSRLADKAKEGIQGPQIIALNKGRINSRSPVCWPAQWPRSGVLTKQFRLPTAFNLEFLFLNTNAL